MKRSGFTILVLMLTFVVILSRVNRVQGQRLHDVRPGEGVTRVGWLSDYHTPLLHTGVNTAIYYLESGEPGPTAFIVGGTHANEIAGIAAATLIIERTTVTEGRLIVIPYANNSATGVLDDRWPQITSWSVETASGIRTFAYGNRRTNEEEQGPDPETYIHYPSGLRFNGAEARNLNRNYPGISDGTLTQQLAHALCKIINDEGVDIAIDLHEAGIKSNLANMLIANPKNLLQAALAVVELGDYGIVMNVDVSSPEFRGLSHKEWGDSTAAAAYLIETPNVGQSPGAAVPDVVNDSQYPLAHRVATHLATIDAIFSVHRNTLGNGPAWNGLPTYAELIENGLGAYLK